jgi:hypothetical protein
MKNKKVITRYIALLLCLIAIFISIIACGGGDDNYDRAKCNQLWDNLEQAYELSGGEDTALTNFYMKEMAKEGCPRR